MPSTVIDIENSFATITRFVTEYTMKQLMFLTGIEGAEIIYNEPLGYGKNAAANSNPDKPALKLDAKDYLIVTYNERFDGQTIDPLTNQEQHNYIFQHSKLGIRLRPITSKANLEFTLKYRSRSYNKLSVWLARFNRNRVVREPHNFHSLMYNYTLPDVIGAYTYDVHYLSEQVAPYGLTLKEFMAKHYADGLMSRSNLSKKSNVLAINVKSDNNLGYFSSLPEEIDSDKDRLIHEISFNYVLEYDKVVELLLEYQIYIHNQRIDSIYDKFFVSENHPKKLTDGKQTFAGQIHPFTEKNGYYRVEMKDIFMDLIDRWTPSLPAPFTSTMLMAPMGIDTNDFTLVENINNFPTDKFPAMVKTIMLYFHQYVTKMYNFPFTLELFAMDNLETPIVLTMSDTGEIRSSNNLDLRKRHYLRLSLLTDLTKLPIEILKLLCQFPEWLIYILLMINPNYPVSELRYLGNGSVIDWESLYKFLNKYNANIKNNPIGGNNSFNGNLFGYYVESQVQQHAVIVERS